MHKTIDKMIFIAHRGNIKEALDAGYFVEVDVWLQNEKNFLGHDDPQYEVELSFLEK